MSTVIGLTGGIGSGKTTVANLFAEYGIDLIDADIIARDVVKPNTAGLSAIIQRCGSEILTETGELDRRQLRQAIFQDSDLKTWLNNTLHPLIRIEMLQQIQQATSPYCLLIIPLMIENNLQTLTDRLLVIDVDEETQIARTMARDHVGEAQVRQILAAQATRSERNQCADDIITNTGNSQTLNDQVAILHQRYLTLATQKQ